MPEPTDPEAPAPLRALALAVLHQAVVDAQAGRPTVQHEARVWFARRQYGFWLQVLGLPETALDARLAALRPEEARRTEEEQTRRHGDTREETRRHGDAETRGADPSPRPPVPHSPRHVPSLLRARPPP